MVLLDCQNSKNQKFVIDKIFHHLDVHFDTNSLSAWLSYYYSVHVKGAPEKTEQAKIKDMSKFVQFFQSEVGHDLPPVSGLVSGRAGANILQGIGYKHYDHLEATQIGVAGGALVSGGLGLISGSLAACGMFAPPKLNFITKAVSYTDGAVISGIAGNRLLNTGNHETTMDIAHTTAACALGGLVSFLPVYFIAGCIIIPMKKYAQEYFENQEEISSNNDTSFIPTGY